MAEESWEEEWKEEKWEIVGITECPKCGSKLETKQAQLYEALLDHFTEVDKFHHLTIQKIPMRVKGVKAEV